MECKCVCVWAFTGCWFLRCDHISCTSSSTLHGNALKLQLNSTPVQKPWDSTPLQSTGSGIYRSCSCTNPYCKGSPAYWINWRLCSQEAANTCVCVCMKEREAVLAQPSLIQPSSPVSTLLDISSNLPCHDPSSVATGQDQLIPQICHI